MTTPGALTPFAGWANTAPSPGHLVSPTDADELARSLHDGPRGTIIRGLGRSYGDPAQNAGGRVVDTTAVAGLTDLDLRNGRVTALAGTSLDDLMRWLVPLGWFVPVTPGTRQVTVGGAIASDVHGKNHHRVGSWCDAVEAITLITPGRGRQVVDPVTEPELFWATAGGMGLTGVIVDATIRLTPIQTSTLAVDTDRTSDLDSTLALMESGDHAYDYSVAWIDLMTAGAHMGRSILDRGRFARLDEIPVKQRRRPLRFRSDTLATFPRLPANLVQWPTAKAFTEAWYRRAPRRRRGHLQSISQFFHPLDRVDRWNRVFGPAGLLQWQCAVPPTATDDLRWVVEQLSRSGRPSFLAVLKRFGPANPGPLSFPMEGWTLALDIPTGTDPDLRALLDRLDRRVVDAGGRLYLAKDSRVSPELIESMYPRIDEWRKVRHAADPGGAMVSDLARRLHLVSSTDW